MIKTFAGENAFLSNFYASPINYEGIVYPTVEHAFQAAKTNDPQTRQAIADKDTPAKAKRAGGKRGILKDFDQASWEDKKVETMRTIVRLKFENPELRAKILATGDQELQEGNIWNDTFGASVLKRAKEETNSAKFWKL